MTDLCRIAHGVLFPVVTDLTLSDAIWAFLDCGGKALLFGETAEEYATGRMSRQRLAEESRDKWRETTRAAIARAGGLIVALDADVSAVHRLQGVTPSLPSLAEAQSMPTRDFETTVERIAQAARELGVNVFLSPTADVVTGENPWLSGRTLGSDPMTVSRLVQAYVRGCRRAGIAATLKHFPGHPVLTGIPASDIDARVTMSLDQLEPCLEPFAAGIAAGARAVMMGPAIFDAFTPPVAASLSPDLYHLLRSRMGFQGLVMTCDLDHRATMRYDGLPEIAVRALLAGADLLLISPDGVQRIPAVVSAIVDAIRQERLSLQRLEEAAHAVNRLATSTLSPA
jgi:beta-N-acetylhexosaminidase